VRRGARLLSSWTARAGTINSVFFGLDEIPLGRALLSTPKASSETVIVKNGNGKASNDRIPRITPPFTVTPVPNHTTWRTTTGPLPAVQAIQSLTCSAFERASRIALSYRVIA
jgi:hypothetical protein